MEEGIDKIGIYISEYSQEPVLIGEVKNKKIVWRYNKEVPLILFPPDMSYDIPEGYSLSKPFVGYKNPERYKIEPLSESVVIHSPETEKAMAEAIKKMSYRDFKYALTKAIANPNHINSVCGYLFGDVALEYSEKWGNKIDMSKLCVEYLNKKGSVYIPEKDLREIYDYEVPKIDPEYISGFHDFIYHSLKRELIEDMSKDTQIREWCGDHTGDISELCEDKEYADECETLRKLCRWGEDIWVK